jgi:AraC family transcriptional regulator, regulatory protein of adaptative response / DNA-3-methyladenine glycosylase II
VLLDAETCYRALKTHDSRFDGRFFVAVRTTRIYCRPVCRVKTPKKENCTFYSTAAAAESSGYRPCLRCRPELAPGNANVDAVERIARSAAALIEEGLLGELGVDGIADRLGVTSRHLRRVFGREFGVTPIAFAQTQRLLLAKQLIADTSLSLTDIAFASGFQSVRRFDALFQQRYRLSPSNMRRMSRQDDTPDALQFELSYRPPYDWDGIASFLEARSIAGVEAVSPRSYRRILRLSHAGNSHLGWIEVTPQPRRQTMRVLVSSSLAKVVPGVLARVKHLFDLSCNPADVNEVLGRLASNRPGLRVPGACDGFEVAVRAVLGQQISVSAARTIAGRLAAKFGTSVESPFEELRFAFPTAAEIARRDVNEIAKLGITSARARTILELAKALEEGVLRLSPGMDTEEATQRLRTIPGIGEWTAQYVAMRALAWPDAFPHSDLALMKAMGEKNPKKVLAAGESWRPWRAYAVMHLWSTASAAQRR